MALQEPVGADRAPQCPFGGNAHRIGRHFEAGQAKLVEMGGPGFAIGEPLLFMGRELADQRSGQTVVAYIVQGG